MKIYEDFGRVSRNASQSHAKYKNVQYCANYIISEYVPENKQLEAYDLLYNAGIKHLTND